MAGAQLPGSPSGGKQRGMYSDFLDSVDGGDAVEVYTSGPTQAAFAAVPAASRGAASSTRAAKSFTFKPPPQRSRPKLGMRRRVKPPSVPGSPVPPDQEAAGAGAEAVAATSKPADAADAAQARRAVIDEARERALEPKVFVPHEHRGGLPPRRVEIERKKRYYASQDISALLEAEGVTEADLRQLAGVDTPGAAAEPGLLAPRQLGRARTASPQQMTVRAPFAANLPISAFDNSEYESRTPEEWLEMGRTDDGEAFVPAKSFYVDPLETTSKGQWRPCTVVGYDAEAVQFAIIWDDEMDERRAAAPAGEAETKEKAAASQEQSFAGIAGACGVSRINLLFAAEDPFVFARRVAAAIKARREAEALLRYNLYVDCMPTEDSAVMDPEQVGRILGMAMSTKSLRHSTVNVTPVLREANIDFTRTMNKIIFDLSMNRGSTPIGGEARGRAGGLDGGSLFAGGAVGAGTGLLGLEDLPTPPPSKPVPKSGVWSIPEHDFAESFNKFTFSSFYTKQAIIDAMSRVVLECAHVQKTGFLNSGFVKPMALDEFEHHHNTSIQAFSGMLTESWTSTIRSHIMSSLKDVGKGWYNLNETNREVYEFSKLRKLLKVVNLRMQDTLRFVVIDSLHFYADSMVAGTAVQVKVNSPSSVENTVRKDTVARLRREHVPLFLVDLIVDGAVDPETAGGKAPAAAGMGAVGSKVAGKAAAKAAKAAAVTAAATPQEAAVKLDCDVDAALNTAIALFDRSLVSLRGITQVEMLVMDKLFWSETPVIQTVNPSEPWVLELRERVEHNLTAALKPLKAYVATYASYVPFIRLDVAEYLATLEERHAKDQALDVGALNATAAKHLKDKQAVLVNVPTSITVGSFVVNCTNVRDHLTAKHQRIVDLILQLIAHKAAAMTTKVTDAFEDVKRELSKFPSNIEELVAIKEYMGGVSDKVRELESATTKVFAVYDVLDRYGYQVPAEEWMNKWRAFGGPRDVHFKLLRAEKVLATERENYLEQMRDAQATFYDSVDHLQREVVGLSRFTDISRVTQVAAHVASLKQQLAEAVDRARLFNNREGLFDVEITEYDQLGRIGKLFEPYCTLWETADEWSRLHQSWLSDPFITLDPEEIEKKHQEFSRNAHRSTKAFEQLGVEGCLAIAQSIKEEVAQFKPDVPLVVALRNPGMRDRHWEELSEALGFELKPDESFTLTKAIDMGLLSHIEVITKVGDKASKEYHIEQALDKMVDEWSEVDLDLVAYRNTGTFVLRGVDDLQNMLDEHVTMTQAMSFSAFKKPFTDRIDSWQDTLNTVSDVLDEWIKVQRSWLYLQPIFDSADIQKQLPTEHKRFSTVDKNWRYILGSAKSRPQAIKFCANEKLLEKFQESNKFLDLVQKGLSDYLETKRDAFARFYFLSNDELLEILSQTKEPRAVQPHLKKCFEGIKRVQFDDDTVIQAMASESGEQLSFLKGVDPKDKNVELWMNEVEDGMRQCVRQVLIDAIADYLEIPRIEWVQKWPGMIVLNGSQLHWTRQVEEAMRKDGRRGVEAVYERLLTQLGEMVRLVRSPLDRLARITLGALTVVDVHAREVTKKLVDAGVRDTGDFEWISQMRYYWEEDKKGGNLFVMMQSSKRPYGYEYLGNTLRLVITPLTDKCYLTLMGALQLQLGGAPAGPAGTGKTETTKDLAKALAKQCVVFNCSDGLDYLAMGKFFKGLASCGAWACFDEFNRIDVEVLSVVAQQIMTLQHGCLHGYESIFFEDSQIRLDAEFAVFITMNPGYAGRTELPDNLKALFRPVAMMVPDYALIGEIMLYSFGFDKALVCAQKMVATFTLCSEQLSSQDHYDYGMRAVKTVITAAGNLKRQDPDMDEEVLLLRALQDVNLPKFLAHDLPLFAGIMSDLFPGLSRPEIDYGDLFTSLKLSAEAAKLQSVSQFMTKCIQLYETIVVRHGLMVVGPTGGGKSCIIKVLADALTRLHAFGIKGNKYEEVKQHIMNPKSVTMGQLYGEFDQNTHEWRDGILASLVRDCAKDESPKLKWMIFDGPVDALWIENMNTVLDDNKKLCLVSGEIIALSEQMEIMFEVEDLAVASPATVSRCGMVYTEPASLGVDPLVQSWMEGLPEPFTPELRGTLQRLFDTYWATTNYFLRKSLHEPVPSVETSLLSSLLNILDCYFEHYREREGHPPPTDEELAMLPDSVEPLFMFSLIWSVGATTDNAGRKRFNAFLRSEMEANSFAFPGEGSVYDFTYIVEEGAWRPWMETVEPYSYDPKLSFAELIIPTKDSVRYRFVGTTLLKHRHHVIFTGPTGTGKTVNVTGMLANDLPRTFTPVSLTFSAQTSANQTQDIIDSKMEKRSRLTYGPTAGTTYVLFVDDFNMPKREKYFAQPPIELLRQWCDYGGWFNRKERVFWRIIDTVLLAAMGPPGGGRNPVTPRMLRHFNAINYTDMDDESLQLIFSTILGNFLGSKFEESVQLLSSGMVTATVEIYNTISTELLPTPAKPHYTFNLRDLGKVFQGVLMGHPKRIETPIELVRLWVHENLRVFSDRLVNDEDRLWFKNLLQEKVRVFFRAEWDEVVPGETVIYGDYLVPGADPRIYEEVNDLSQLVPTVEEYLMDYNAETQTPMKLVMFMDAIEHVSRISRILRQPQGNALLLGVGGSGRQSLTRLATFMAEFTVFQIEVVKGYGKNEWREDLRTVLKIAGIENRPVVFLFNDAQIVFEGMLEDVNNILNAGDVPNLYAPEDMDLIVTTCRRDCLTKRITPTKVNIFAQYIMRVRANIHVVICMSPMGAPFRDRLRMFPSLVNCCTIDWFSAWPDEALRSVATASVTEVDLRLNEHVPGVVEFFKNVHLRVQDISSEYYERLRRYNYVTPTSYLELLSTFRSVLESKREEVGQLRSRLKIGLDKLVATASQVAALQIELREMEPQLIETQAKVEDMLVAIQADKASAAETKAVVEKEEHEAETMAQQTQAIADDAQRDLDEALPALDKAVACLNKLKKSDLDEVRAMKKPPQGVKLTMHAACIMFGIKPVLKRDEESLGKKIKDYWEAATKSLLTDANKLLRDLKAYDKDNISKAIISEIEPFMSMPEFEYEAVDKSSKACSGICLWVRAMYKYYLVSLQVEPKKKKLAEAQAELDRVMASLNEAKAKLQAVVDRIADLESQYETAVARKEQLKQDVEQCRARLERAQKLLGGLGGEKDRWTEEVAKLSRDYNNLMGDALLASATIAYLGAFTSEFRQELVAEWQGALTHLGLPHTAGVDLSSALANPVEVRQWTIAGLPTDQHSLENGIIMATARRWPLLIDPQGQANRFIKNMGETDAENGLDVVRESDKNFLRDLENGVRFGKWVLLENVGESLEAALEPILLQQKFKQGGTEMIRLGDSTVAYNDSFRFFMTTKLPNPHYQPEVAVKVSLLNFTITPKGLEDQLLGVFVVTELPELEERKNSLVMANARMQKELKEIENRILFLLSNSKGNILDDAELIDALAQAKVTSTEITVKVAEAEETEREIDETREQYRPVAYRASILYFCITDLATVDPMYQYSLPWFTNLFVNGIRDSEPSSEVPQRIENLNAYFTFLMYNNVCRSLFERHKLLFSFLMCVKIMQGDGRVDAQEWRFLISGQGPGAGVTATNPQPEWITQRMWDDLLAMSSLPAFDGFLRKFGSSLRGWRAVFDSTDAHKQRLPGGWDKKLTAMQKLCVLRCLRPDKVVQAVQEFVTGELGAKFIEPPPFDIAACFADSNVTSPLIFVLSTGSDPTRAFYDFAEQVSMRRRVEGISLGQGQGVLAAKLIKEAMVNGQWVLLQNCHLAVSWMPDLERICENINPAETSKDFRLWLTSMPSKKFPVSVLQNGVKMTNEPPKGLRQNLKNFYFQQTDESLMVTSKPETYQKLLFGLAFFHANVLERRKFGPLGWNVTYEFNDSDLEISKKQLELFLDAYELVPYKVLNFLVSYINYGGRVTDDKDLRTIDVILKDYFRPAAMKDGYKFSPSGVFHTIEAERERPQRSYMQYVDSLPLNPDPEVFGMHENANISCDQRETFDLFDTILALQPRTSSGGGKTREEQIADAAKETLEALPPDFDVEQIAMQYPVKYEESMNTVLVQECIRYNALLVVMKKSLADIQRALVGLVVMSADLEAMGDSMYNQKVPVLWEAKAYPSLKPLAAWTLELLERLNFLQRWVVHGPPPVYWISGFFFPQAFLTGTLQNYARKYQVPIDTLSYNFTLLNKPAAKLKEKPENGCYIRGLFLEGARWSDKKHTLTESRPKQLYTSLPVIHLEPEQNRPAPTTGVYRCPVYKVLSRRGTLSTTGHSTNFVMFIELPSSEPDFVNNLGLIDSDRWIKAGVAAFCSLRY